MGQTVVVRLEILCKQPMVSPEIGVALRDQMGMTLHLFVSTWEGLNGRLDVGRHTVEIEIPQLLVYPGRYVLIPWIKQQGVGVDDQVNDALIIQVVGADITGHQPYFERYSHGKVYAPSIWHWL